MGTAAGAVLGTSTVTTFVESAAGVNEGGRSGLTAFSAAVCFALALFFAPFFLAVPQQATAPALFLVGVMMMADVAKVPFDNFLTAIPCFICMVLMPLTYSISDGILIGLIVWVLLHAVCKRRKDIEWGKELNWGMVTLALLFILKYAFL